MPEQSTWTLLTNHGAALVHVAEHPDATIREVADAIGVQERAAARILSQLRDAGYLTAQRIGRRNVYQLDLSVPLRHDAGGEFRAADLLNGLVGHERWGAGAGRREGAA
jgi:DNA-binding transcriptional ArsR family regulator